MTDKAKREREYTWVWPFPRLRFFLRHGFWCPHVFGDTERICDGYRKLKRCERCDYAVISS